MRGRSNVAATPESQGFFVTPEIKAISGKK
jgi:hypothetical protein